jgi:subtilisin family serine protease
MKPFARPVFSNYNNRKASTMSLLWLCVPLLGALVQAQQDEHFHHHRKLQWASPGRGLLGEFLVKVKTPMNPPHIQSSLRTPVDDPVASMVTWNADEVLNSLSLEHATVTRTFHSRSDSGFRGFAIANLFHRPDLDKLLQHDDVVLVEQDQLVEIYGRKEQTNPPWGVDRLDQSSANLDNIYAYDFTGNGVQVFVVDTGILTTHRDFLGRVSCGYNAVGGTCEDEDGHGTHMAGKYFHIKYKQF